MLSHPWDHFDAYLFDIDGTLLNCEDAVHYFAFCDALSVVAKRPLNLDGVITHGNTDEGILRDAFALGGVDAAIWQPQMEAIRAQMGTQVEAHRAELRIAVLPGVREVLTHLQGQGALLSTATGNLARIGEVKLAACGLREFFALGGWSDGLQSRTAVFQAALAQVRARLGAEAAVCVVGDTPADVQAAHACGLEVIAVATGVFSREQLALEGPELCLGSLLELPVAAREGNADSLRE